MSQASQAVVFVKSVVEFMTGKEITEAIKIWADNQAAIAMVMKASTMHGRSKHIRVKYHFIRQLVEEGIILFQWKPSEENCADMLTKPLGRIALQRCLKNLMFPQITEEECQDSTVITRNEYELNHR